MDEENNNNERKYEILPGVAIPDLKAIRQASENFESPGLENFEIKAVHRIMPDGKPDAATADELSRLQALGEEVAETEEREKAESRKRMDNILMNAVSAPVSMNDLKKDNAKKLTEEQRKQLEESMQAEAKQKAEEDAKLKAREERRKLQQRLLEEARARADAEREGVEYEGDVVGMDEIDAVEELEKGNIAVPAPEVAEPVTEEPAVPEAPAPEVAEKIAGEVAEPEIIETETAEEMPEVIEPVEETATSETIETTVAVEAEPVIEDIVEPEVAEPVIEESSYEDIAEEVEIATPVEESATGEEAAIGEPVDENIPETPVTPVSEMSAEDTQKLVTDSVTFADEAFSEFIDMSLVDTTPVAQPAEVEIPEETDAEPIAIEESSVVEEEPEVIVDEPVIEQESPVIVDEPVAEDAIIEEEPVIEEPSIAFDEPVVEEPAAVIEEPVIEEPVVEEIAEPVAVVEEEAEPVIEETPVEAAPVLPELKAPIKRESSKPAASRTGLRILDNAGDVDYSNMSDDDLDRMLSGVGQPETPAVFARPTAATGGGFDDDLIFTDENSDAPPVSPFVPGGVLFEKPKTDDEE